MSLDSHLDVLEEAMPPTSRFVAWIDATMRGDEELARKLEDGGERVQTVFTWKPFGIHVHAAIEVAESLWHELHLTYQMRRGLEVAQWIMGTLLDSLDYGQWLEAGETGSLGRWKLGWKSTLANNGGC